MKKKSFCVVTQPLGKSGANTTLSLIQIVKNLSSEISIITGREGCNNSQIIKNATIYCLKNIEIRKIGRLLKNLKQQIEITRVLLNIQKNIDTIIFFIGGEDLFIPALIVRLLRKELIIVIAGFPAKNREINKDPFILITPFLSRIVLNLSNKIIVYSNSIIKERKFERYKKKITVQNRHHIDTNKFFCEKSIEKRTKIGFVGSLTELKGIKSLTNSLQSISEIDDNLEFIFVGNGPLNDYIKSFIKERNLENKVTLLGWVDRDKLPLLLNQLKLLILPSFTEGLPNVIIESMACGTPVLANSVGSIPDIITDGENGFLMDNNSTETIITNVKKISKISSTQINIISKNARKTILESFTYEKVIEGWENVLK